MGTRARARQRARVQSFPLRKGEKRWTFLIAARGAALSFGRNPSAFCLNMCTTFCALPYLLVNDLLPGTPRPFLSVTCAAKKRERLLTVNIIKKKSGSRARATGKLLDLLLLLTIEVRKKW